MTKQVDPDRRRWPRIVLTLPPATKEILVALARENYRAPKSEALLLLTREIERAARRDSEK